MSKVNSGVGAGAGCELTAWNSVERTTEHTAVKSFFKNSPNKDRAFVFSCSLACVVGVDLRTLHVHTCSCVQERCSARSSTGNSPSADPSRRSAVEPHVFTIWEPNDQLCLLLLWFACFTQSCVFQRCVDEASFNTDTHTKGDRDTDRHKQTLTMDANSHTSAYSKSEVDGL